MAILVGIDEAGYGPHLGPLVVAGSAIVLDSETAPDAALWGAMRGHVRRRVGGRSRRVVICDSKQAYAGGRREKGLAVLERAVLGFLAAADIRPRTLADLLAAVGVAPADGPAAGPWHQPEALRLPVRAEPERIAEAAGALTKGFAALGGRAGRLRPLVRARLPRRSRRARARHRLRVGRNADRATPRRCVPSRHRAQHVAGDVQRLMINR